MAKRKSHSPDFKAKVALEVICGETTMAEMSKKHGVHLFPRGDADWNEEARNEPPRVTGE